MGFLEVDVEGFEADLTRDFTAAVKEIRDGAERGVRVGAREGVAAIRAEHTYVSRSGELERNTHHVIIGWSGDKFTAKIIAGTKYASYVEKGTQPHLITGNPTLSFWWKGERVHFRFVNHPGSKPYPFMHLALTRAERVITREVELGVERAQAILNR